MLAPFLLQTPHRLSSPRSLKRDFPLGGLPRPHASASIQDHGPLTRTLSLLDQPGFVVDFTVYTSLLRYCRKKENLAQGKRVHNHITRNGLEQDLYLGSLLILMYSDCGAPEFAHTVFDNLLSRDEFSFTIILRTFARHDSPQEAFQTFEQMYQEGVCPNKRIFISMFCSCAHQLALSKGKQMHASFLCTVFSSDVATNTALINMYIKCGSRDHANWIFDTMAELDAIAWNVMISSCLEISQGWDALQLFHHMEQQGVTPSKVTFIHALDACVSEVTLGKGTELHCRIMGTDVESDMMVETALINMYGKCGGVRYANRIFSKMVCRDEVVWSAMISAYAENAQARCAIQLSEQMLQEGMLSNKYIMSSILSGCATECLNPQGKRIHAYVTRSGFALDVAVGNALVNLYGKIGCMDDAWKVFYKMLEHDLVSWNAIIGACAENRQLQDAYRIFEQMQQHGILVDKSTFVNLLSACASQEDSEKGRRVHALTVASSVNGDIQINNALVNLYGKCGNLCCMREIFDLMDTRNSDRLTFSSILSMCANNSLLSEGTQIHELFQSRGFQPDKVVGSALISLYGKCGSLVEAKKIFDGMPEHDVVIWNSLLTAFSQNGQGENALELYWLMQQQRIKPTGITFINVLSACSHVGLVEEACYYFDSMTWYGITPIVDHYNCMIDLLGRAGRLEEAEKLLNTMSVEPTVSSLMTLLGACRNILDYVRGRRIAEKVFLMDPVNPSPYVILSNIYAAAGKVQDAGKVMKMMKGKLWSVGAEDPSGVLMMMMAVNNTDCQVFFEEEA